MMGASAFFLWATRKKDYENAKWLKLVPFGALALPYLANASGWILTEMGRQPWIVFGLLKVQDAVSPNLTTLDLLISLIGYTAVYGTLAVAMVKLMLKYAKAGPEAAMHESVDVAPALVGADD
jgi:cytochrome d ubiquinol oxidase subunit I